MDGNESAGMSVDLAREIARQGEVRLTALTSLATAADLRAATLCGIFGATAVAIGAAALANGVYGHPIWTLIAAGMTASLGLFSAAIAAARAAMPQDFYVSGGNPDELRQWSWDGYRWRSEVEILDATALRYSESIRKNRQLLEKGSWWLRAAFVMALASPIAGIIASGILLLSARFL